MFKGFDLPDLTSLGEQLGSALAKAGADIEQATDNALGTTSKKFQQGEFELIALLSRFDSLISNNSCRGTIYKQHTVAR